jgi:hypothetical protein
MTWKDYARKILASFASNLIGHLSEGIARSLILMIASLILPSSIAIFTAYLGGVILSIIASHYADKGIDPSSYSKDAYKEEFKDSLEKNYLHACKTLGVPHKATSKVIKTIASDKYLRLHPENFRD